MCEAEKKRSGGEGGDNSLGSHFSSFSLFVLEMLASPCFLSIPSFLGDECGARGDA